MKKTTIILSLLITFLILLFPLIGNSFMQKLINQNLQTMESKGLLLKKSTKESGYLNTKQHFEFVLQNTKALQEYFRVSAKRAIPAAVHELFQGATIAADIAYSNIPFSKAVTVEVYPLKFSDKLMREMQKNNPEAYKYFMNFLHAKGLLYHIEYNMLSGDFNGFIKDIEEHYNFKENEKLGILLKDAKFKGNGNFLTAKSLAFNVQRIHFDLQDAANEISADIKNLRSKNSFESFFNYTTATKIFAIRLLMKSLHDDIRMSADNIDMTSSSAQRNEKVVLHSKSFIDNLVFRSNKLNFSLKTFNSDISIDSLDTQSYETLSQLLAYSGNTNKAVLQEKIQKSLLELLSHGLHVKVSDLSLQNITINKVEELGKMKITGDFKIKKDKDFIQKLKISPMLLLPDVEMKMNVRLAKTLYLKVIEGTAIAPVIVSYAKQDAQSVYFDIEFKDTKLIINDKVIQ